MRERLREVPEVFAARSKLLRVKTQVVRITEHLVEEQACLFRLMRTCQALNKPKRTGSKTALGSA